MLPRRRHTSRATWVTPPAGAVRDFRRRSAKSRRSSRLATANRRKSTYFQPSASLAHLLLFKSASNYVFRAAVLSIALTLAAGQNAALLCKVWCHPSRAAGTSCEHQDQTTTPSATGDDNCANVADGAFAIVRENVGRGASAPDPEHALAIPGFRFAPPPTDIRSGHDPGQQSRLAARPLVIALRI